jgi:hypothetical protein
MRKQKSLKGNRVKVLYSHTPSCHSRAARASGWANPGLYALPAGGAKFAWPRNSRLNCALVRV